MNDEHKFIYRIVCEPKITKNDNFTDGDFVSKLVTNMATMRLRAIDDSIIFNLREIGREKNIDLLIGIDESKVMKMVKDLEASEIVKNKKVNIGAFDVLETCEEYNEYSKIVGGQLPLTEEEFATVRRWLYE